MRAPLVSLGSIAQINPRLRTRQNLDVSCSFIPMDAVDEGYGNIIARQIAEVSQVSKGYTAFEEGDVLFAKITPCMENGKSAIARHLVNGFGYGSTEFHVIRPSDKVTADWIYFFLKQKVLRVLAEKSMKGSAGQKRVPPEFLEEVKIPLPPLEEQMTLLSQLWASVRLKKRLAYLVSQYERLMQSAFLEMFGEIGANSCSWNVVPVSEFVADFETGKSIVAAHSETKSKNRVLKVSAITWNDYDPSESKPLPPGYEPPFDHFVRAGDLLFSRANTSELVGAVAFVFHTPPNMVLPDKIWRFVWNESVGIDPLFVWQLFRQRQIREEIGRRATGTSGSMKNISMERVMEMMVPLPPLANQQRFGTLAGRIQMVMRQKREMLRQIDLLTDVLLRQAFAEQDAGMLEPA